MKITIPTILLILCSLTSASNLTRRFSHKAKVRNNIVTGNMEIQIPNNPTINLKAQFDLDSELLEGLNLSFPESDFSKEDKSLIASTNSFESDNHALEAPHGEVGHSTDFFLNFLNCNSRLTAFINKDKGESILSIEAIAKNGDGYKINIKVHTEPDQYQKIVDFVTKFNHQKDVKWLEFKVLLRDLNSNLDQCQKYSTMLDQIEKLKKRMIKYHGSGESKEIPIEENELNTSLEKSTPNNDDWFNKFLLRYTLRRQEDFIELKNCVEDYESCTKKVQKKILTYKEIFENSRSLLKSNFKEFSQRLPKNWKNVIKNLKSKVLEASEFSYVKNAILEIKKSQDSYL